MHHRVVMADASTPAPRLLLAYDGSEDAAKAIRAAAELMTGADAQVLFVRNDADALERAALARIAVPDEVLRGAAEQYEREAAERASNIAERGRQLAEQAGLHAAAAVRTGTSPWRALCRAADDEDVDAIVCGARGQGALSRALLGSTSSSILHHAHRPVLVVPAGTGSLDGPTVIGYDGSEGARVAIAAVASILPRRAAVVVHVWLSPARPMYSGPTIGEVPISVAEAPTTDLYALIAAQARACADEGAALAQEVGLDARGVAVESAFGEWHVLSATAEEERAAVIVTGCRGRTALASTVLGSVSAGLVHNAERPVLIVRDRTA